MKQLEEAIRNIGARIDEDRSVLGMHDIRTNYDTAMAMIHNVHVVPRKKREVEARYEAA